MKIKNKFKFNKLFLYVSLNSFHLFFFLITILNNLKTYKILINFNYIYIYIYFFFHSKTKHKIVFFFSLFLVFFRNHFFFFFEDTFLGIDKDIGMVFASLLILN